MKRDEVLNVLKAQQEILAEQFGIKSLYLFGSTARDEARPGSDVDLLVEFNRPLGLFEFIDLQQTLESLLNCKVDLGTKRSLKNHIRKDVLREAILVT